MPRYHFTTTNGERHLDGEGTDLPDLDAARVEGAQLIGFMLRDHPDAFWQEGKVTLQVTDEHGMLLFEITASAEPPYRTGGRRLPRPRIGLQCRKE